ncbi:MAG TPA: tRNA guanosine(34) transglycosylase Tgt [Armatimonadota bacterium]|nr:tRNA guanosine(34) transglycosylase Tgt [Armatimonadota bacterium]
MPMTFEITGRGDDCRARVGRLELEHGTVLTPAFMPCASRATVRACSPDDLTAAGVQILVGNAYHLHLQPGEEVVGRCGGLHRFMCWDRPILTDSGGFQVFSLASPRDITEEGVTFRSPVDGSEVLFTPELSVQIQLALGSDIAMPLDECCAAGAERPYVQASLERTLRWAERCLQAHVHPYQQLFGIVQGGTFPELRRLSARETAAMGFPGFGIGGLSVGEGREVMLTCLRAALEELPESAPVHLMGVGTPLDLVDSAAEGADLFDCVLPTRNARHGSVMTREGVVRIARAEHAGDPGPLEDGCECPTCAAGFSRAYLRHLFKAQETLGWRLLSVHNLHFYTQLMARIRQAIPRGDLQELRAELSAWSERDRQ